MALWQFVWHRCKRELFESPALPRLIPNHPVHRLIEQALSNTSDQDLTHLIERVHRPEQRAANRI